MSFDAMISMLLLSFQNLNKIRDPFISVSLLSSFYFWITLRCYIFAISLCITGSKSYKNYTLAFEKCKGDIYDRVSVR